MQKNLNYNEQYAISLRGQTLAAAGFTQEVCPMDLSTVIDFKLSREIATIADSLGDWGNEPEVFFIMMDMGVSPERRDLDRQAWKKLYHSRRLWASMQDAVNEVKGRN